MHPFPPASELQFLIGLEVGQICLDPWSTQFRFSEGGQITIEGPFEYLDAVGKAHVHQAADDQDRGPVHFRDLIQRRITSVEVEPLRLMLGFENGAQLSIVSEIGRYENGQISPPSGHALIVF
ncbi:hypothetical protein [Brevundimonas sp.]|jgi:hypothetical protein|uniref:hypothetical protein n=1 Tax=Brevundimonas sp. TaxID=1871086 RepID=UPI00391F6C58